VPDSRTILTRVVFGAAMIAGVVAVLLLDELLARRLGADWSGVVLAAAGAVLALAGVRELAGLARAGGAGILPVSATLGTLLLGTLPIWRIVCPFAATVNGVLVIVFVIPAGAFLEAIARRRVEAAMGRISCTVLSALYLGLGLAMMLVIRLHGLGLLVLFLAAVKFTDIAAYFTGTAVGRHKLIAWLSPGKTWEGLAGGLAAAAGVSALVAWALALPLSAGAAAVFGAIVGLVGQFGDLAESLLKRSAAVKDSGAVVPQFGGVLDILDSPLLAAPVAWLLLYMAV